MNTAAKIQTPVIKTNLVIVHTASNTPSYCIEEVDIDARQVTVAYFDENVIDSELEYKTVPLQDLVDFTNEFYRDYTDSWDAANDMHVQERVPMAGYGYLKENLNSVVTDYLNAKF
jgi:hypothetical protein